jgi:transposase-like protein
MVGHGTRFGAKKKEAIAALLRSATVDEAARDIGIAPGTLYRWKKDPEFDLELRAARRAACRQAMARLAQGITGAVKSTLQIMYHGKRPATRLKAAQAVIRLAQEAHEIEDFAAALKEAERISHAAPAGNPRVKSPGRGHGAKSPHKRQAAIAALLTERSIADAARTAGTGTETLYRWMRQPAFLAEYMAAAVAAFGPAMMLAQQRMGDAVTVIRGLAVNTAIPEETRLRADLYIVDAMKGEVKEDLRAHVAELEPVLTSLSEPQVPSQTIGRSLHQRLQEVKAGLLRARSQSGIRRMILVHAVDGRPAGSSVKGPDGRQIWLDPPEGCRKGEPVAEQDGPVRDEAA